mmetsp:Transcript_11556/g.10478  ORF Transcript_11556/g.10478 Transcript_11556/m.10478 type:complete len:118 (+) Transcript_11556:58-411(+)
MSLNQEKIKLILNDPELLTIVLLPSLLIILVSIIINSLNSKPKATSKKVVNLAIKKDQAKVVDSYDCNEIEKIAEFKDGKLVLCRCWRSSKFPYCDGSHVKHNKENDDNVGPLIIKK